MLVTRFTLIIARALDSNSQDLLADGVQNVDIAWGRLKMQDKQAVVHSGKA